MEMDALYRNNAPKHVTEVSPAEGAGDGFMEMTPSELKLMQDITLHQMRQVPEGTELLVLGRVWYRLEQERRRRNADLAALERMYFAR